MKDPRNEYEASRLIQDSGFGRIREGKPVDWASPRRRAEWPTRDVDLARAAGVVLVIALGVAAGFWGLF